MACDVLVADPPWKFDLGTSTDPSQFRGTVDQHYPALSLADICAFPLPPLARDAHLFLWRVASMQQEALDVAKAWGFVVKSEIVWLKRTATDKRWFGMGRRVRMEHETCLIATRGSPKVFDKSIRSTFEAKVPGERHSAKPPEFFEIVEKLCGWPSPDTHVELFARSPREGWSTYGNELAAAHPGAEEEVSWPTTCP